MPQAVLIHPSISSLQIIVVNPIFFLHKTGIFVHIFPGTIYVNTIFHFLNFLYTFQVFYQWWTRSVSANSNFDWLSHHQFQISVVYRWKIFINKCNFLELCKPIIICSTFKQTIYIGFINHLGFCNCLCQLVIEQHPVLFVYLVTYHFSFLLDTEW